MVKRCKNLKPRASATVVINRALPPKRAGSYPVFLILKCFLTDMLTLVIILFKALSRLRVGWGVAKEKIYHWLRVGLHMNQLKCASGCCHLVEMNG